MDASSLPTPELLARHGRFVRALARGLLSDEHLAEDVAQEAWARWVERGPRRGARPWLRVVTRNLARNALRARGRRAEREERAARPEALPSTGEQVEQADLLRRVVDAVLELEEPYRSTILERYLRGLDARSLARESAVPLATVRSREQRALETLRRRLARELGGDRRDLRPALVALASGPPAKAAPIALLATSLGAKLAAAALIALGGIVAWQLALRTPSGPARPVAPTLADAEKSAEPTRQNSATERAAVGGSKPLALRITGRVVDLPCSDLGMPGGPAASVPVSLGAGVRQGADGPHVGQSLKVEGRTDGDGRFDLLLEVGADLPWTEDQPLAVAVRTEVDERYRPSGARVVLLPGEEPVPLEVTRIPFGLLVGSVVTPEGQPLPGVPLQLIDVDGRTIEVESGADGSFRAGHVRNLQRVESPEGGPSVLEWTYPKPLDAGGWEPIRVVIVPQAHLRIAARDTRERPIEGLGVRVTIAEADLRLRTGSFRDPPLARSAKTDAEGVAILGSVWSGVRLEVRLSVGSLAWEADGRRGQELLLGAEPGTGTPIVLEPAERGELEAHLADPVVLRGRVVHEDGSPSSHPSLVIVDAGCEPWNPQRVLLSAEGGPDGRFALTVQVLEVSGPLRIIASEKPHEEWDPLRPQGWPGVPQVSSKTSAIAFADVDPVALPEEILVVLEPTRSVAGRVLGPDGAPVRWSSRSRMWATPAGAASHFAEGPLGALEVETSEEGRFRVGGVHFEAVDLFVSRAIASGFFSPNTTHVKHFSSVPAGAQDVELRLDALAEVRVRVRLVGATPATIGWLQGRLFPRDPTSLPLRQAERELQVRSLANWPMHAPHGLGGGPWATHDELGRWQMGFDSVKDATDFELPPVGPGWYVFGVQPRERGGHSHYPMATELLHFEPGDYTLTFELVPTTDVQGRLLGEAAQEFLAVQLVDAEGRPLPLRTGPGRAEPVHVLPVATSGAFELLDVPQGSFRLRAGSVEELRAGRFRRELPLELGPEPPPLELRL